MSGAKLCPACGGPLAPASEGLRRCASFGSAVPAAPASGSPELYAQPAERRLARPRVLDLGAGDGRLAVTLARSGHRVTAVEPFRHVPAAAPGLTVVRERIENVELPQQSFDAAVLWHVLEHLAEPRAVLERVRSWLVPGGRVLVGAPNLGSLQARVGRERWFHLDPQRHLVHFTPAGLVTVLERAGFSDVHRRPVLIDQALGGMWMTLLNRVTRRPDALRAYVRREGEIPRRNLVVTTAVAVPLLPAAALLELGAVAAGRAGRSR
jgi:SAM-dependent methyltransferase